MALGVGVAQRVVERVLVLVETLRVGRVGVEGRVVGGVGGEGVELAGAARELVRGGEAALRGRVVAGLREVEAG